MSLINELKRKSNETDNVRNEVVEEIKGYFDEYLDGDGLENFLKLTITETDVKVRKKFLAVKFWEYHSGCSDTHFYCAGKTWNNPENSSSIETWDYKGVRLSTIDKEIGEYLSKKLEKRMGELGFTMLSKEHKNSRFDYYEVHYYYGW